MKIILNSMLALAIAGSPLLTQEPDEKEKPKQQEPKKQPEPKAKPAQEPDDRSKPKSKPKQEPAPPSPQQKPDEKQQQQDEKERQKQQKEQAKKEKNRPQEQSAPQNNRQHQATGQGQRIPPEQFRARFGREHHFRVAHSGGDNRRFQYGGYWFEVVEVWPAGWSFDDDCYIEEDGDDYYLVDLIHPEIRILVTVFSA